MKSNLLPTESLKDFRIEIRELRAEESHKQPIQVGLGLIIGIWATPPISLRLMESYSRTSTA